MARWLVITAALVAAAMVGRFVADGHIKYGVAIVLAACYAPLVFFNVTAAVAVWVALLYFDQLRVLSWGPNAAGVILALGWIGAFIGRRWSVRMPAQSKKQVLAIVVFGVWLLLTISWSPLPSKAGTVAGYWWLSALLFLIVASSVDSPRGVRMVAVAFVAGAVISVLIGLVSGTLAASDAQAAGQGRFHAGGGDPNEQAAAFVAAMFLTIGLFSVYQTRRARRLLLLAFCLVTVGFVATQSRGGLIALVVATVLTMIVAPRQRRRILGLVAIAAVAVGVLVAINPGVINRIVNLGGGSSGRSDLWTIGWRVFTSHPITGIGIGNFQVVEAQYVLRPGGISAIQYVADKPYLVHNVYLQLLAETGIVGLTCFLVVVASALRVLWLAISQFERGGHSDYADLARAVMMGTIGMLAALFFISDGSDFRLWALFGLSAALLAIAQRERVGRSSRSMKSRLSRRAPADLIERGRVSSSQGAGGADANSG